MLAHLRTLPGFTAAIQSGKVERINYVLTLAEKLWSDHGQTSQTGSGTYDRDNYDRQPRQLDNHQAFSVLPVQVHKEDCKGW